MAPKQPLQSQPAAAQHSKSFDRFVRITRASRFVPASARKKNRKVGFIKTQNEERHPNTKAELASGTKPLLGRSLLALSLTEGLLPLRGRSKIHKPVSRRRKSAVSAGIGAV